MFYNNNNNNNNNNRLDNNKTRTSKSFKYKKITIQRTPDNENTLNAEVVNPLKYLSNFCEDLLIYCEIEVDFSWSRYCIISEILRRFEVVPKILTQLGIK